MGIKRTSQHFAYLYWTRYGLAFPEYCQNMKRILKSVLDGAAFLRPPVLLPPASLPGTGGAPLVALLLLAAPSAWSQQVTDPGGSGPGTLRDAVSKAAPKSTITFALNLSGQTINLGGSEIQLIHDVTIDASSLSAGIQLTQSGSHPDRIFDVAGGTTVSLKGLTLLGGGSGGANQPGLGGAILNRGNLTLTGCTLKSNNAIHGGAIYNYGGTNTLNQCTLNGNVAHIRGSLDNGGAIFNNGGVLTLNECTLSGNSALYGGGGGAIYNYAGSVTINQSTITKNLAQGIPGDYSYGGGIANDPSSAALYLFNCVVAGNSADQAPDIDGSYTERGANIVGGDPLLLPLGNYGGPTQTMPPRTNSPALNAGADSILISPFPAPVPTTFLFPTDQRGLPRAFGAHVDLGAVELQSPIVVTNLADAGAGSLRQALSDLDPVGGSIFFAAGLSGGTITLTGGEIPLTKAASLDASALAGGLTLSGGNSSRIFYIGAVGTTLRGLTFTKGSAPGLAGGALYSAPGSTLLISHCAFFGNSALEGGAILNDGILQMDNCTLSGNTGSYGGALQCRAPTALINCTLAANNAPNGGGVFNKWSTLTVNNSIIAENTPAIAGRDIYSQLAALVFTNANLVPSLVEDQPSASRLGSAPLTSAPLLAPLGNYGGPTPTMPPFANSPAIDAGDNSTIGISATDQRGSPRLVGTKVDLGAVEFQTPLVTNPNDSGPGSLRDVIQSASPEVRITFAPSLSGQTISLSSGELLINRNLTIDASSLPAGITLNGNNSGRVFNLGANVILNSLTIRNGFDPNQGGGIYNRGVLTLNNCTLANNGGSGEIIPNQGGGIYNANTLTINQCTLSGNAANYGGGIFNAAGASLAVNQSTLSENTGQFGASALFNFGSATLFNSIASDRLSGGLGGTPVTLIGNNLTTGDPMLAGLGNYGGATPTMPPVAGSPAIDAGSDAATNSFATDQRGGLRLFGTHVDLGAVEVPFVSGLPAQITDFTRLAGGSFQFHFTNLSGASFTVFATTDAASAANAWANLGPAVEKSPGTYQFTDLNATNFPLRFYRVTSP